MAESSLHKQMKKDACDELLRENYSVLYEPMTASSLMMTWRSYRPDLLGVRTGDGHQDYALVECETRPSTRKLLAKNYASVGVQVMIDCHCSIRRILVVPKGSLSRIDSQTRSSWETWVYDGIGFRKIPLAGG